MKISETIYSQLDHGFSSVLTFLTFVVVKSTYGISAAGYFGILLSLVAIVETIQQGLYERPVYLNHPVGFKNFKLNTYHIFLLIVFLALVLDRLIYDRVLIGTILFSFSQVMLRNIRIYDYSENKVSTASNRSFYLFVLTFFILVLIYFEFFDTSLNNLLIAVSFIKLLFLMYNRKKIFYFNEVSEESNQSLSILISSILILIKNRLPLWALLPFGLGLVGIFETFRTLVELFLMPSKGLLNLMSKEIEENNNKKIFKYGLVNSAIACFSVLIFYNLITSFDLYNHKEIRELVPLVSASLIVLFSWISETFGILLVNKKLFQLEVNRRIIGLVGFLLLIFLLFDYINYERFLVLVVFMYFLEIFPVFFSIKNFISLQKNNS